MSNLPKEKLQRSRSSKTFRLTTTVIQQTNFSSRSKKKMNEINPKKTSLGTLRPPDPSLFIYAGTSGVRHLFPIHLTDSNCDDDIFSRSISRLRSRTPTTNLCSNIEMIRNSCLTLRTLEHLDISSNELDDLPIEISSLNHLESFNCSHNHLITIPDLFEKLTQLKEFDLSFNQFKSFPTVIYKFQYLIRLNCEHNFLKKFDSNFLNLQYLKILILDHNQFQSFDTIDFSLLKSLEYLHIAHNQLTKVPFNLEKLTHLKNLNLSHNHLTSIPIEIFLINTLDVINLSHNFITKLSPLTDTYKRTTLIFSIDLSFNQLTKFYDYLVLICLKLDLSNNKIQLIPFDLLRKFDYYLTKTRELKIANNPLLQPMIPHEILNNQLSHTINMLQFIRTCLEEQQYDSTLRQGFKISITGCKKSGKSSLAYCLEESMPLIPEQKEERIVNILQFPFQLKTKKSSEQSHVKFTDVRELKKPSSAPPRQPLSIFSASTTYPPTTAPLEHIKSLPVAVFDFTGTSDYYEHMSPFIDTNSVHLICIHTADFHQTTPDDIANVFKEDFDRLVNPLIEQLFQILQLLCEKVTEKNGILIIPIATCIDLYDKRSTQDKFEALEKINQFFQIYLQSRRERILFDIEQIHSLHMISSSLSDRLKIFHSLLNLHIQIESCQPISSLSYQGINELNQKIQQSILTQKTIFPYIDRIFPTLWADANQSIESLAEHLPVPYLLWENFTSHILTKYGLPNLINDIARSLYDQGKIIILEEIGTKDRLIILRPLWLGDLLSILFHNEIDKQEFRGCFSMDYLRSIWSHLVHRKEYFSQLIFYLMRFLLIAYPKMNKKQMRNLWIIKDKTEIKFDSIIIPSYLPSMDFNEIDNEKISFTKHLTTHVHVRYQTTNLPLGLFHRYSVSILLKFDFIYMKHWKNILIGEHEEKPIKFLFETDHQSYVNILCGTNVIERSFDQIWNVLMLILNHFEEIFKILAPNHQFHRLAQCPCCHQYSFMGEWMTPKELQGLKQKSCLSCGKSIDTNYLVQPNESKRKNEELIKKIRERNARKSSVETSNVLLASV